MLRIWARWRPNFASMASEISPTVAPARAASTLSSSRLPSPDSAQAVIGLQDFSYRFVVALGA
jgi:hypothetical protein